MARLRGAIFGYGFIASKGHMPAYKRLQTRSDSAEIVAIVDSCDGRRAAALREHPDIGVFADAETMFRACRGALDFIDIATPPVFHYPLARLAVDSGLHVLCEKPLVFTCAEAADLVERARNRRRVVMPCHNYRHAPVIKAMGAAIDAGRIGEVNAVTLNTFRITHARGVPEWMPDWRRNREFSGGGIVMDHGSHSFYVCFDWLRSYPSSISAKATCLRPRADDVEDNFAASLEFPGGLANVHLTWTAGVRKVIYTVQGERGGITAEDDAIEVATQRRTNGPDVAHAVEWIIDKSVAASHWMDASHSAWFEPVFEAFFGAIDQEEFVPRDLIDACMCVATIDAAYRSAADGGRETAIKTPPFARGLRAPR